jgi:predicted MPP superfamily phosphohydrolase
MKNTIILRFRDLIADTIAEHTAILESCGEVWWGWWRKTTEPTHLDCLGRLASRLETEMVTVGLYNRAEQLFFVADVTDCIFDEDGKLLESPNAMQTPSYYNTQRLRAWFKIVKIVEITQEEFVEQFSSLPLGDETLFAVDHPRAGAAEVRDDIFKVNGNLIVHLSDLHFGSDYGFPQQSVPGKFDLLTILAQDIKAQTREGIGLLIISGDLTSRGDATPLLNVAIPFLHSLCEKLSLELDQVIIVPGNHDIPFNNFSLGYDHEKAFFTFMEKFYGSDQSSIELKRFLFPQDQLVEVLPINSVKLRSQETSDYGWVDWQSYKNVLDLEGLSADSVRVAVLHHHLAPIVREERIPNDAYPGAAISVLLNAGTVVEELQRYGFRYVLHGHQHTPAVSSISRGRFQEGSIELEGCSCPLFIVAGGSSGVMATRIDGEFRDNTYGIYKLDKDGISLRVRQFNPANNPRDLFRTSY